MRLLLFDASKFSDGVRVVKKDQIWLTVAYSVLNLLITIVTGIIIDKDSIIIILLLRLGLFLYQPKWILLFYTLIVFETVITLVVHIVNG